jgi:hypothetical protein
VSIPGQVKTLLPWLWRFAVLAAAAVAVARLLAPEGIIEVAAAAAPAGRADGLQMRPLARRPPLGDYVRPQLAALWRRLGRSAPEGPAP